MITRQEEYEICRLALRFKDQTIQPDEFRRLEHLLQSSSEAVQIYNQVIELQKGLFRSSGLGTSRDAEPVLNEDFWKSLAKEEITAPATTIQAAPPQLLEKVVYPKQNRQVSRLSLFTLVFSAAAIMLLMVFIRFAPGGAREVATLVDSIDAKWAGNDKLLKSGVRLKEKSSPLWLNEGIAKVTFDNGCTVVVEGPAEFRILAEDRLRVTYGRIYAVVPRAALGFSVLTPNSAIIDLGTEFGVIAGIDGTTELHVIKGQTALVAGHKDNKSSLLVNEGFAKRICGILFDVTEIRPNAGLFVHNIDSSANFIWRGDDVNLADIVGGGDGFGAGSQDGGISPLKGSLEVFTSIVRPTRGPTQFQPTRWHPLIDGIFVPAGQTGAVQISSAGHIFENCPETNTEFWQGIFNGAWHGGQFTEVPRHHLKLGGRTYGTSPRHPAIYMHANQGITFDLLAVRNSIGNLNLTSFQALAGISETVLDYPELIVRDSEGRITAPLASFHVLVDGVLRLELVDVSPEDAPAHIHIPLTPADRFLTLITTQGSDNMGINQDWTLFANPVLQVER